MVMKMPQIGHDLLTILGPRLSEPAIMVEAAKTLGMKIDCLIGSVIYQSSFVGLLLSERLNGKRGELSVSLLRVANDYISRGLERNDAPVDSILIQSLILCYPHPDLQKGDYRRSLSLYLFKELIHTANDATYDFLFKAKCPFYDNLFSSLVDSKVIECRVLSVSIF